MGGKERGRREPETHPQSESFPALVPVQEPREACDGQDQRNGQVLRCEPR